MPRITLYEAVDSADESRASMRPGRNAPDNAGNACARPGRHAASMRPGRNAPDNRFAAGDRVRAVAELQ